MRMVMPIGVDDFAKVRREYYFVDKTGFLAQFVRSHAEVTLFTRPLRYCFLWKTGAGGICGSYLWTS